MELFNFFSMKSEISCCVATIHHHHHTQVSPSPSKPPESSVYSYDAQKSPHSSPTPLSMTLDHQSAHDSFYSHNVYFDSSM
mmetsp:Transcript_16641/g.27164  ORF Transcript_16641/g.27164 Transcript_16641/m.27164 type:complete len:81 (-) Transcript_16641:402-644(-)